MTQPTAYAPITDFEAELGTAHGTHLNAEFNNLRTTLSELLNNIALIQRDDEKMANKTVHPDTLTTATMALLGTKWTPKGLWLTATNYYVGDVVEQSGNSYVCCTQHVSGTFATDKSAGKWVVIYQPISTAGLNGSMIAFSPTGSITSSDVQAAIAELGSESVQKSSNLSDIPTPTTALSNLNGMPKSGGAFSGPIYQAAGASIAAAGTVNLATATGNTVSITGAATISSFGTVQAGSLFVVEFAGVCTLTYNATSMKLPGSANITTAANDIAIMMSLGSGNWKCINYQRNSVAP